MAWFKKTRKPIAGTAEKPSRVPEGLWVKCPGCTQIIYNKDLEQNLQAQGYELEKVPYVLQLNKRDLPTAIPVEEMVHVLRYKNEPDKPLKELHRYCAAPKHLYMDRNISIQVASHFV